MQKWIENSRAGLKRKALIDSTGDALLSTSKLNFPGFKCGLTSFNVFVVSSSKKVMFYFIPPAAQISADYQQGSVQIQGLGMAGLRRTMPQQRRV